MIPWCWHEKFLDLLDIDLGTAIEMTFFWEKFKNKLSVAHLRNETDMLKLAPKNDGITLRMINVVVDQ